MITNTFHPNGFWSVTGIPLDMNYVTQAMYHIGHAAPRYPLPVIMQHFEFAYNLTDKKVVLLHAMRGPYD